MAELEHWDRCMVSFHVRRAVDMSDINNCDELPLGWVCLYSGPRTGVSFEPSKPATVDFSVKSPTMRDGQIVRRILGRLGSG